MFRELQELGRNRMLIVDSAFRQEFESSERIDPTTIAKMALIYQQRNIAVAHNLFLCYDWIWRTERLTPVTVAGWMIADIDGMAKEVHPYMQCATRTMMKKYGLTTTLINEAADQAAAEFHEHEP